MYFCRCQVRIEDLKLAVIRDRKTKVVECNLCTSGTSGIRPLKHLSKHLQKSHGIAAAKASIAQTMLEEAMAADDQVIFK